MGARGIGAFMSGVVGGAELSHKWADRKRNQKLDDEDRETRRKDRDLALEDRKRRIEIEDKDLAWQDEDRQHVRTQRGIAETERQRTVRLRDEQEDAFEEAYEAAETATKNAETAAADAKKRKARGTGESGGQQHPAGAVPGVLPAAPTEPKKDGDKPATPSPAAPAPAPAPATPAAPPKAPEIAMPAPAPEPERTASVWERMNPVGAAQAADRGPAPTPTAAPVDPNYDPATPAPAVADAPAEPNQPIQGPAHRRARGVSAPATEQPAAPVMQFDAPRPPNVVQGAAPAPQPDMGPTAANPFTPTAAPMNPGYDPAAQPPQAGAAPAQPQTPQTIVNQRGRSPYEPRGILPPAAPAQPAAPTMQFDPSRPPAVPQGDVVAPGPMVPPLPDVAPQNWPPQQGAAPAAAPGAAPAAMPGAAAAGAPGAQPERAPVPSASQTGTPTTPSIDIAAGVAAEVVEAGTPTERKERGLPELTLSPQEMFMKKYREEGVPIIMKHFMRKGDLQTAEAFDKWARDGETQAGITAWSKGVIAASMGDEDGFFDHMVNAFNADGYFDDGYSVVKGKSGLIRSGGEGEPLGARLTFRNNETGEEVTQEFTEISDLYKLGINFLAPEAVFEHGMSQIAEADEVRKGELEHERAIELEIIKAGGKSKTDIDAIDAEVESLRKNDLTGRFSGLPAADQVAKAVESIREKRLQAQGIGRPPARDPVAAPGS